MKKTRKYPLLVSMIISCVLVITSLFIFGFFGMNFGPTLGGGSQFEITMPADASSKDYVSKVKEAVSSNGYTVDSCYVEDKYIAGENETEYTQRCLVVKIAKTNISDDAEAKIINAVSEKLGINVASVSSIDNITSVIKAKNILFLGLAIGIVAICLFVMGWIRYDLFAGISFILAFLHNIIVYLSILILSRVQLNLTSLAIMLVLTLVMSGVLIHIYERNREESLLHTGDKVSATERMISCETQVIKPYAFVAAAVLIFAALLFIVPVTSVRFTAINIIISLIVTSYTSLIVGPGVYSALLEVRDYRHMAVMSRNDEINKEIKKKVRKSTVKKQTTTNK